MGLKREARYYLTAHGRSVTLYKPQQAQWYQTTLYIHSAFEKRKVLFMVKPPSMQSQPMHFTSKHPAISLWEQISSTEGKHSFLHEHSYY